MRYDLWMAFLFLTPTLTFRYHTKTDKQSHYYLNIGGDFSIKYKFIISKRLFVSIITTVNNGIKNGKETIKK